MPALRAGSGARLFGGLREQREGGGGQRVPAWARERGQHAAPFPRVRGWERRAPGQVRSSSAAAAEPVRGVPGYLAGRGGAGPGGRGRQRAASQPGSARAPLHCPAEFGGSCRWGARSPLAGAMPSARGACAGRGARRGPARRRGLGRWVGGRCRGPAGGGHAFGCGRAGFGPGLPWQPLARPGAPRPPAVGEPGSSRCAPSGLNQALGRRGEGRPGFRAVPRPAGRPWGRAPT